MKFWISCPVCFICGVAAVCIWCRSSARTGDTPAAAEGRKCEKFITGHGYIRGRSRKMLCNKYGAFYSDSKVTMDGNVVIKVKI